MFGLNVDGSYPGKNLPNHGEKFFIKISFVSPFPYSVHSYRAAKDQTNYQTNVRLLKFIYVYRNKQRCS